MSEIEIGLGAVIGHAPAMLRWRHRSGAIQIVSCEGAVAARLQGCECGRSKTFPERNHTPVMKRYQAWATLLPQYAAHKANSPYVWFYFAAGAANRQVAACYSFVGNTGHWQLVSR